ncbi:MAG: Trk system potassium transporter TrkA [Prevotellaceae bacterium]|jgi:trk system potassium uptake protein TrkA|nr:Trk system potassium transporter TrkA [Prevotellaceae bacterium]
MKIIIVGAGDVGKHLAKRLLRENVSISIMDENPERMRELETYDMLTYQGSPTSIFDLKEIGSAQVDLFIAVTPHESVNMTACMIATNLGAKWTLARIDNNEYLLPKNKEFFKKLGVDYLIYPEALAAKEIVESMKMSWMRQYLSFCNEALILLGVKVRNNAEILDKKFLTGYFNHSRYRVVAIKRDGETIIPMGPDEIKANDIVYFITTKENLDFVRTQAGKTNYQIKNIMILGGSRIAQKIAQFLPGDINVKILEKDRDLCYALSEKLDNALIVNSDGRDIEVLKEEGIEKMDAFVAVTPNSEENILACSVVKRFGIERTIAEVENLDYILLAENMDIGMVINKKMIAAGYIHQITLDAEVLDVRILTAADAEVIEFVAKKKSKITRDVVKNLHLPPNVNIGGIVREGKGNIVDGNTRIMPDDHVIVFCEASSVRKLEHFF